MNGIDLDPGNYNIEFLLCLSSQKFPVKTVFFIFIYFGLNKVIYIYMIFGN